MWKIEINNWNALTTGHRAESERFEHSALNGMSLSNPSTHTLTIYTEEGAERLQDPEVMGDYKKAGNSRHTYALRDYGSSHETCTGSS